MNDCLPTVNYIWLYVHLYIYQPDPRINPSPRNKNFILG